MWVVDGGLVVLLFFFFKQKTAYEMRISDWSSDVCSSDLDRLSQQTLLLTYASPRVTSRGPSGQPDLREKPGLSLDFVARQGLMLAGKAVELKFEARNLTGRNYQEAQESGDHPIYFNRYKHGRTF